MGFSTFDNDNDAWSWVDANCAAFYGGGANWWGNCGGNNMNGKYGGNGDSGKKYEFMWWLHFDNNNLYKSLKTMTWMFRQVD